MNFSALGIQATSSRDTGSSTQYSFGLPVGDESSVLTALLGELTVGCEVSVLDPENADCSLEVRRKANGFEVKRGCHGSHGTWRQATAEEAHAWLLPVALAAPRTARPGFGATLDVPKGPMVANPLFEGT